MTDDAPTATSEVAAPYVRVPLEHLPRLQNDRLIRAVKREPLDRAPVWVMRQAGRCGIMLGWRRHLTAVFAPPPPPPSALACLTLPGAMACFRSRRNKQYLLAALGGRDLAGVRPARSDSRV